MESEALNKKRGTTMRYPIVFYTTDAFPIPLIISNRGIVGGLNSENDKVILKKYGIDGINSGKYKWGAFDASGIEYMVIHVENIGLYFNIFDMISFSPSYYVKFEFKKIQELEFSEFKERILKMLKTSAHKWKKAGHDSQTDGFLIGKIIRAETIEEIIRILQ